MIKPKIVQKCVKIEQKLNLIKSYIYIWVLFCDTPFCNIPVSVVKMEYVETKNEVYCIYNIYPALMIYPGDDIEIPYNSAYMISSPVINDLDVIYYPYDDDYPAIESLSINEEGIFIQERCLKLMREKLNQFRVRILRDDGYNNRDWFCLSVLCGTDPRHNCLMEYIFTSEIDKHPESFISYDTISISTETDGFSFKYEDIRDLFKTRTSSDSLILKSYTGEGKLIDIKIV